MSDEHTAEEQRIAEEMKALSDVDLEALVAELARRRGRGWTLVVDMDQNDRRESVELGLLLVRDDWKKQGYTPSPIEHFELWAAYGASERASKRASKEQAS
jgi:hypothetical protein